MRWTGNKKESPFNWTCSEIDPRSWRRLLRFPHLLQLFIIVTCRNNSLQECTPIAYILVNESLELLVLLFEPVQCQMRTPMSGENDRGSFHLYA
jgi:hypothetical protein